jgi:hypothetical protein
MRSVVWTALKKVRNVADEHADRFDSEGFKAFFEMIRKELGDDYFGNLVMTILLASKII